MQLSDFDYFLPKELIASKPAYPRDQSRLMFVDRKKGIIKHYNFHDLPDLLNKNSVLAFNNSKVINARLFGVIEGMRNVEILLTKCLDKDKNIWEILAKGAKYLKNGSVIYFNNHKPILDKLYAIVLNQNSDGSRVIQFTDIKYQKLWMLLPFYGVLPLPPYIKNFHGSEKNYQTIYAKNQGSIAAPTAGLHFTKRIFQNLKSKGISMEYLTLHVGLGTFMEVRTENIKDHIMHEEMFEINKKTAKALNKAKSDAKKIVSIGTTTLRSLESSTFIENGKTVLSPTLSPKSTNIFIYPGYKFKFVDQLVTNFHLPKSTLLMLVSAFAGKDLIFEAYSKAIENKYRFFSFGDAMVII